MSHEITFDEANNIVNVVLNGTLTLEERKKVVDEMSFLYSHLQSLLILFNVRGLVMDLTMDEQKIYGKYCASLPNLKHARVAVLHKENHNPNFLIDSYVVINGAKQRAQFDNEIDARNWLKGT